MYIVMIAGSPHKHGTTAQPAYAFIRGVMTAGSDEENVAAGAVFSHKHTISYLGWEDAGQLLALNSYTVADLEKTDYLQKAYAMGKAVK